MTSAGPAFRLDRSRNRLLDATGRRFDPVLRTWSEAQADPLRDDASAELDALAALRWLQRDSGSALRIPVGVIGPREATDEQLAAGLAVGELLGDCGVPLVCGGRHGVMQAVSEGAARTGGVSIGILGDADPGHANPYVTLVLATGIGEARNALIARAAFCLIAIGDSYGTLSEIALGRQFDKLVVGLCGAAHVDGVRHVGSPREAVEIVALHVLGIVTSGSEQESRFLL
jgi:uncharacterized protein (TIGR00725 family)